MKKQLGFTLVELVIVVIVIGILSVVAVPKFMNMTEETHTAVIESTADSFQSALVMVRSEHELAGNPGEITIEEQQISFKNDNEVVNWPQATNKSQCADLFNNITMGSGIRASSSNVEPDELVSTFDGSACNYTYQNKGSFEYDMINGEVIATLL